MTPTQPLKSTICTTNAIHVYAVFALTVKGTARGAGMAGTVGRTLKPGGWCMAHVQASSSTPS